MAPLSGASVWEWTKREIIPDVFVKRRFNFITIHYLYLIGWTIVGSAILYGIGGIAYIDSLFFASGAATQSGLNTVDVDLLSTGQQVVLYTVPMFCNPIVVNSFVVFIRLYWFEKRFKDIVNDARFMRKSKSKSRNNTMANDDPERGTALNSVRGRNIQVLRDTGRVIENVGEEEKSHLYSNEESVSSSDKTKRDSGESTEDVALASRARTPDVDLQLTDSPEDIRPRQISPDQHIAFLERQRNPADNSTLRIPSPREFDRGGKPENLRRDKENNLTHTTTSSPTERRRHINFDLATRAEQPNNDVHHITIDEPNMFRSRERPSHFPQMNSRQPTNRSLEPPDPDKKKQRSGTFSSFHRSSTEQALDGTPYLDFNPTIGRNSFFVDLTEEEREKLGGIEYRALKTLALTLMVYFFAWQFIGVVCLLPWILRTYTYGSIIEAAGQGRVWWAFFTSSSSFNDVGFTLTATSMIPFQDAIFPLLLMTFLIVIGNTGFPCMLRFCIWMTSKCVRVGSGVWEEFQFLLDHPRRCFTLLFPRGPTWWLFSILIILNGLDLIFFIILDLNDPIVTVLPPGIRVLDGLFQASSTRTAGFSVVNLAELHPAIQVSYLIMMYISAFPIAISMRRTNVYEEKSLGIYGSKADEEEDANEPSYVGAHVRKQLSFDLWYIFLGMFIIAIAEGNRLQNANDPAFTLFSVLFEIVSAYGTVGLSLGYPTINASFSAEFSVVSKLVIIAMQIRGRHRGLPYELDRAILLPSESLHEKEKKEGRRLMARRRSSHALSETSAVEGTNPSGVFRAETGLASGYDAGSDAGKKRHRDSHDSNGSGNNPLANTGETHRSKLRVGLGTAMAKLADHPQLGHISEKSE